VNTLVTELATLKSLLDASSAHIRIDALFKIPLRMTPRVSMSDKIKVEPLFGAEANNCVKEVLTQIILLDGQNAKETIRAPGAIGLPSHVLEQVKKTNLIRSQLFEMIGKLKPKERKSVWRKTHGISSLQALRTTVILEDPQFINIFWHVGTSGTKKQAKDLIEEWDKTLVDLHGYRPRMEDTLEGSLERKLVFALDQLEALDDTNENVSIHRAVAPHVRARFKDGDKDPRFVISPTPFVYDIESPPPQITALEDYCPAIANSAEQEKKKRSKRARLMAEPYIESMYVYRYLEEHRSNTPATKKPKKRYQRPAPSA
jgi:hypothetical protein